LKPLDNNTVQPIKQKIQINTPIGSLSLSANTKEGDFEYLDIASGQLKPEIPKGMGVEGCIAVLLSCLPSKPLSGFEFKCQWEKLKQAGYGCTGEALDAWEWESNGSLVIVGTEDSEWLNSRLGLEKDYTTKNYPVTMHNNIVNIEIEEFAAHKELTLHYVIAWNKLPEPVESSCWYAVDVPHERILGAYKKS